MKLCIRYTGTLVSPVRRNRIKDQAIALVLMTLVLLVWLAFPVYSSETSQGSSEAEKLEQMTLEQLLNIEVTTAGKKAERIGEIPASVVVIRRDDIEKYGYQNLGEILENIPGLFYTDDYFTKNFGVRGFWTVDALKNITVLINDIPQMEYLVSSNFMELFAIPAESIDRIEVVRGPMSVMYGTGAFFGAINIFTNKVGDSGPYNFVSASYGSENSKRIAVRASGKFDEDVEYAFNGSFFDTDGLNKPLDKMGTFSGTTKGKLEANEKYFNFSGKFKRFFFDTSYSQNNKEAYVALPSMTDGMLVVWKAMRLQFGYRNKLSEKLRLDARLGYFVNHWTFDYDWLFSNFYGKQTNNSSGIKSELNLFYDPSSKLKTTFGLNYTYVPEVYLDVTIPAVNVNLLHFTLAKGESIVSQSIFAQADYLLTPKMKVIAGVRLDQMPSYTLEKKVGDYNTGSYSPQKTTYSDTKVIFVPRLALIYSIDRKNFLKFLYGKAINRPSFFQNFEPYNAFGTDVKALDPETIQTFELNYTGNISSEFSLSVSLFRNMLNKLIFRTYYIENDTLISYQANVGKMNTNGVEITAQYSPFQNFQIEFSGTYQDTQDKKTDITPGYSPRFLGYIKASYIFNEKISLALTGNYVDKMETYWDSTLLNEKGTLGKRIGDTVDAYFLLGANLRANNLFGTGLFLNLKGSNLLDHEVRYPATSNNSGFASKGTIGRGISFLLTLGWKF